MKTMTAQDIESFRRSLGLSQAELADRLGVSQASVSQWETGKKHPRKTVLKLLETIRNDARKTFRKAAI
jgi:DNA-binding transcriptional regulator YiaG